MVWMMEGVEKSFVVVTTSFTSLKIFDGVVMTSFFANNPILTAALELSWVSLYKNTNLSAVDSWWKTSESDKKFVFSVMWFFTLELLIFWVSFVASCFEIGAGWMAVSRSRFTFMFWVCSVSTMSTNSKIPFCGSKKPKVAKVGSGVFGWFFGCGMFVFMPWVKRYVFL